MCLPLPSAHLETWSAIHEVGYRVACAEALTKCKSILWNTRLIPWCWKKRPATAYLVNILNMITRQSRNNHQKPKRKVIMTIIKLFEHHLKCLTWIFELWHLSPIFVLLKLTYLVTLFDSKLQIDLFLPSVHLKCKRSSLRSQSWMRHFLWFLNTEASYQKLKALYGNWGVNFWN